MSFALGALAARTEASMTASVMKRSFLTDFDGGSPGPCFAAPTRTGGWSAARAAGGRSDCGAGTLHADGSLDAGFGCRGLVVTNVEQRR